MERKSLGRRLNIVIFLVFFTNITNRLYAGSQDLFVLLIIKRNTRRLVIYIVIHLVEVLDKVE
jgi:hypothetical protein